MRVLTLGTFDLFHYGHICHLRACCKLAGDGEVVVALNTDSFVRKFKGEHPVIPFSARVAILNECKLVSRVVEGADNFDCRPIIADVAPDLIVIGTDWAERDYYKQLGVTQAWLDKHNITVVYVPYTPGISSSKLRRHICD